MGVKLLYTLLHVTVLALDKQYIKKTNPVGYMTFVLLILVYCVQLYWRSTHPEEVSVSVVIQPVVNHYIPRTIVVSERR